MRFSEAVKYYSDRQVQEQIVKAGKNREVIPSFGDKGFGKRPAIIMYEREIYDLARKGATSFHASEERWINPLMLQTSSSPKKLDELRKGWDLILDIDTEKFEYAKKTTALLVEALKSHGIKHVSLKFSGNKGFHVGVPFESFPKSFSGKPIKELFPEAPRTIAEYLKFFVEKRLAEHIGEQPFQKVSVDTVFLAPRHLFRMPYSLHEKSGLVSLPIPVDGLERFKKKDAKPSTVSFTSYLQEHGAGEALELFTQAYNWIYDLEESEARESESKEFLQPKNAAPEELFPPCIKKILLGVEDGRKRSVFVLINFLRSVGWSLEMVEKKLYEWNEKNYEPLRQGYIKSQLNWHKRLKTNYSPPNCDNKMYYEDLGVKCSEHVCSKIKNPAVFTLLRMKKWRKKSTTKS
jgi:hypothetical protein